MIARPVSGPTPAPSTEIYIEVADPDDYHKKVKSKGVTVVDAIDTHWCGDRNLSVQEPHSYKVWFYKTVKEFGADGLSPGVKVI